MPLAHGLRIAPARLRFAPPSWRTATAIALTVGVVLRLIAWLHNRSFWLDEVYLALNVTGRSFTELWQPLDHDQGAPVGFLMLVKAAHALAGDGERVLRFVPLVSGLLALALFARLARRLLRPDAACFAVALFACAPKLIHYSAELKQYSTDVLATVALLLILIVRDERRWPIAAVAGAIAVWFSHPALFVLAGVGVALGVRAWATGDMPRMKQLVIVGAAWLVSFALCYWLCLRDLGRNSYLLNYWSEFFAPVPPRGFDDAGWYVRTFARLFDGPGGIAVADVSLAAPAGLLYLFGMYTLARSRPWLAASLAAPLLTALVASALHKYPFGGRLLLFAVPLLFLGIAESWTALPAGFGRLCALTVLAAPALTSLQQAVRPNPTEDTRPLIEHLARHWQPGDGVYLSPMAQSPFDYYGPRTGLGADCVIGRSERGDWAGIRNGVAKLSGRRRVWFFVTHDRGPDQQFILWQLDQAGRRIEEHLYPGCALYRYDLSSP